MDRISFVVKKPLYGYRQTTKRMLYSRDPKIKKRNRQYVDFKNRVLALAMEKKWRCKAVALKEKPPRLSVAVRWNKGPRIDWANVYKGIEDALFSDDRHVIPGSHQDVEWDAGTEEALVIIET